MNYTITYVCMYVLSVVLKSSSDNIDFKCEQDDHNASPGIDLIIAT